MKKPDFVKFFDYDIYKGEKEFFSNCTRGIINTLNPHSFITARRDPFFMEALKYSDYLLPDGIGIVLAVNFLKGIRIKKIAGSDLHEVILESLSKKSGSCFYLGAIPETLEKIVSRISAEHPEIRVGSYSPPFRNEFSENDLSEMTTIINDFSPDVLFVGMTAPKQEKFVHRCRESISVPMICSIGAAFDFYAGVIRRSGKFWIKAGFEWLPRLFKEPKRLWKRNFVSSPLFLLIVFKEKFIQNK